MALFIVNFGKCYCDIYLDASQCICEQHLNLLHSVVDVGRDCCEQCLDTQ